MFLVVGACLFLILRALWFGLSLCIYELIQDPCICVGPSRVKYLDVLVVCCREKHRDLLLVCSQLRVRYPLLQ